VPAAVTDRSAADASHLATPPCVHVVDDDASTQAVFRSLGTQLGWDIRCYGSIGEFQARADQDRPGCIVFDLMLPDGCGIDALQQLSARGNRLPVVFTSGLASVSQAVRALQLGSLDFVEKPFEPGQMRAALQRAVALDDERRRQTRRRQLLAARLATLSRREAEVMECIVQGAANKAVALRLGLSPKTVEVHRANVMRKTGSASLAELVRLHVAVHGDGRPPAADDAGR
jgi:FixJ family two-component response regulator